MTDAPQAGFGALFRAFLGVLSGVALLILGFFMFTVAAILAAVALLVGLLRVWWLRRAAPEPARAPDVIEVEYERTDDANAGR